MSDLDTIVHQDPSNEKRFAIERVQDVEDILEWNKSVKGDPQPSDWGRHIARIPNIFLEKWLREEHDRGNLSIRLFTPEFDRLIARKLQDPDYRFLRVDR